ncbi:MAG: NUMOD3 domain-containing DNA-binding protein [Nanoarchaeota archaeon]
MKNNENISWHKRKPLSEEHKRKLSESNKGKHHFDFLGKHHTDEAKRKISEANKGHPVSEEVRKRISESNKTRLHPMKGKHLPEEWRKKLSEHHRSKRGFDSPMKGEHHSAISNEKNRIAHLNTPEERRKRISETLKKSYLNPQLRIKRSEIAKRTMSNPEARKRLSEFMKGKPSAMKGRTHSEEAKRKMSLALKGRKLTEEQRKKLLGRNVWNKGKVGVYTQEQLNRMSESMKGRFSLEKNPSWKGGISFEPYTSEWNDILKKSIRQRDNNTCQICFNKGKDVHHIDYNKKNCNQENLITLCQRCHSKTGTNREKWKKFFEELLKRKKQLA